VQHQRVQWCRRIATIDPERFVFLDETATHVALTRLYGRAAPGKRVVDAVPHGHWRITTLVAAVRLGGATAPLVFEGATDTAAFRVYVERVLVPELRAGDIVVMDNLSPHKGDWVAEELAKAEAEVWYLPPYSPDYNPIEAMWAKVKAWLRKEAARTGAALVRAIGQALGTITSADCLGFFKHCGYSATRKRKPL